MRESDKYIFDSMKIDEECYLLLCCFLSSNKLNKICISSNFMHFKALPIKEEQKIKQYLISIAIKLRMIDYLMKDHNRENHLPNDDNVGFIKTNNCKNILSIREACNKIIHARSLKFVYRKTKDKMTYLKPIVYFSGQKNKKDWKASIDIFKFAEIAVYVSNEYDEIWDVSGYT